MPASEKRLGDLHAQVAETLIQMVSPREIVERDDDGEETGLRVELPAPAALAVAVAFLKNNSITADVAADAATKELADRLAARGRISKSDLKEALDSVGKGLLN